MWRAVVDFSLYRETLSYSTGRVLRYVFILVLLVTGVSFIKAYPAQSQMMVRAQEIVDQLPLFILQGGVLNVEGPQPLVLVDEADVLVIIDTSGSTSEEVLQGRLWGLWVGENKMVSRAGPASQTHWFGDMGDGMVDNSVVVDMVASFGRWYPAFAAVGWVAGYLIAVTLKLAGTALLAFLAFIPARLLKRNLPYAKLWRISAYAVTAPTLLFALLSLGGYSLPMGASLHWALALFYVSRALASLEIPAEE